MRTILPLWQHQHPPLKTSAAPSLVPVLNYDYQPEQNRGLISGTLLFPTHQYKRSFAAISRKLLLSGVNSQQHELPEIGD